MNRYAKIFGIGLQNTLVYRWNFLLRALFDIVPLVGTVFLWRALFQSRAKPIAGYEWQIAADIRDGQINALLAKPVDYLGYRMSLFVGYRLTSSLFTLPVIILLFAYFHQYILLPKSITTWLWTGFSLGMAALLQFFLAYAIAMLSFWILEISTVVFIVFSFEYFLSGHLFPLDLMPGWLQGVLVWLPFTYELYFPVAVFQEKVTGALMFEGLLIQAGWVAMAWATGRMMWLRGLRRFQAVGG